MSGTLSPSTFTSWRVEDIFILPYTLLALFLRIELVIPPELGIHSAHHLLEGERLGHIIVRAELEHTEFLILAHYGGHDDDRDAVLAAQGSAHLVAVHYGHHDVQQDEIGLHAAGVFQRLRAVERLIHSVSRLMR